MCLGLEGYDPHGNNGAASSRKLGDITLEPYASSKTKNLFKPTTKTLAAEVVRRFKVLDLPKAQHFRPKNKPVAVLQKWLMDHPIVDPADVVFLRREEKKLYDGLVAAADEAKAIAAAHAAANGGGNGIIFTFIADLRMVHCLTDNQVKTAFMERHIPLTREQLDARNSPIRPKSWDELLRDKFNDRNFTCHSELFPLLHSDFAESHDLHRDNCPQNITAENAKAWVADRKAKLVILMNRWELSGNGDGQRTEDDANFGNVSSESIQFQEGDNRSSFLLHERSTLLYIWESFVKYEMLQNLISILPESVGVTSSRRPTGDVGEEAFTTPASSGRRKKRNAMVTQDNVDDFDKIKQQRHLDALGQVLEKSLRQQNVHTPAVLEKAAAYNFVSSIHDKLFDLMEKVITIRDAELKNMYDKRIKETKKRLLAAEVAYKKEYDASTTTAAYESESDDHEE
jgi:hypothetical protein